MDCLLCILCVTSRARQLALIYLLQTTDALYMLTHVELLILHMVVNCASIYAVLSGPHCDVLVACNFGACTSLTRSLPLWPCPCSQPGADVQAPQDLVQIGSVQGQLRV